MCVHASMLEMWLVFDGDTGEDNELFVDVVIIHQLMSKKIGDPFEYAYP